MSSNLDKYKDEIKKLKDIAGEMAIDLLGENLDKSPSKNPGHKIRIHYQKWYTEAS